MLSRFKFRYFLVLGDIMYRLNFQKRVWIVKGRLKGDSPSQLALAQGVSEGMVRRLVRLYKQYGFQAGLSRVVLC